MEWAYGDNQSRYLACYSGDRVIVIEQDFEEGEIRMVPEYPEFNLNKKYFSEIMDLQLAI